MGGKGGGCGDGGWRVLRVRPELSLVMFSTLTLSTFLKFKIRTIHNMLLCCNFRLS